MPSPHALVPDRPPSSRAQGAPPPPPPVIPGPSRGPYGAPPCRALLLLRHRRPRAELFISGWALLRHRRSRAELFFSVLKIVSWNCILFPIEVVLVQWHMSKQLSICSMACRSNWVFLQNIEYLWTVFTCKKLCKIWILWLVIFYLYTNCFFPICKMWTVWTVWHVYFFRLANYIYTNCVISYFFTYI